MLFRSLAIEKQFGRGSIMKLGSAEKLQVEAIPTGSIALDLALGVGGIPRGRITEIYGPESSGKTTLCQVVASYLKLPLIAVKLGDLKGSLVGETNEKTSRALDQIDAVENAVVWFDEFDKQTADADSSGKTGSDRKSHV